MNKNILYSSLIVLSLGLSGCERSERDIPVSVSNAAADCPPRALPDGPIDCTFDEDALTPTQGTIYLVDIVKQSLPGSGNKFKVNLVVDGFVSEKLKPGVWTDVESEFQQLLRDTYVGNKIPRAAKKRCKTLSNRPDTYRCTKIDGNLSLTNKSNSFIAFLLSPSIENWQYIKEMRTASRDGYEDEVIKMGLDSPREYYGNLKKMDEDGNFFPRDDSTDGKIVAGYFIAAGELRLKDLAGNSGKPLQQEYQDRFNLYIKIVDDDGQEIPIVVDPDVRWPGGNGGG